MFQYSQDHIRREQFQIHTRNMPLVDSYPPMTSAHAALRSAVIALPIALALFALALGLGHS